MKVAVLMSTYNGHKFLNQQLDSLAKQTIADCMTVYIRDDGSCDDTIRLVEQWKERIDIILYKGKNIGSAKSFWELFMNKEIQADYYAFCDQDDVWDSDKLETSIYRIKEGACLYACNCRIIDEEGKIVQEKYMTSSPQISLPKLFISGFAQGCSMTFSDALRKYVMDLNIECITMHDSIVMLYSVIYGKVYWDSTPHFGYRMHSNNVVAKKNKNIVQKMKTTYRCWKNEGENSKAKVAAEILKNVDTIQTTDLEYLQDVANYRTSMKSKIKILFTKEVDGIPMRNVNSYRMRIILNLY